MRGYSCLMSGFRALGYNVLLLQQMSCGRSAQREPTYFVLSMPLSRLRRHLCPRVHIVATSQNSRHQSAKTPP